MDRGSNARAVCLGRGPFRLLARFPRVAASAKSDGWLGVPNSSALGPYSDRRRSGRVRPEADGFHSIAGARSSTVSKNANGDWRTGTRGIDLHSAPVRPNGPWASSLVGVSIFDHPRNRLPLPCTSAPGFWPATSLREVKGRMKGRTRALTTDRLLQALVTDLAAAQVAAGLTQEEVAARMWTTKSVVSRLESGVRTRPTLRTIESSEALRQDRTSALVESARRWSAFGRSFDSCLRAQRSVER